MSNLNKFGLFGVPAVILLMLAVSLRGQHNSIPENSPAPWNSPAVGKLRKDWEAIDVSRRRSKDDYEKGANAQFELLNNTLSVADLRKLASSCDSLPADESKRSEFEKAVLAFMVIKFVHDADRSNLTTVLATRCPSRVYLNYDIEYFLAFRGEESFKDCITMLGEAYKSCNDAIVRHTIAAAIRRGFGGHGISGQNDADFVKNAMIWYQTEKDSIELNHSYTDNEAFGASFDLFEMQPHLYDSFRPNGRLQPLFVRKASSGTTDPGGEMHATAPQGHGSDNSVIAESPTRQNGSVRETKTGHDGLEGEWEVKAIIHSGEVVPLANAKVARFEFRKDQLLMIDQSAANTQEVHVEWPSGRDSNLIDMVPTGGTNSIKAAPVHAILEMSGDELKVCMAPRGELPPKDFKSRAHSGDTLVILRRQEKQSK